VLYEHAFYFYEGPWRNVFMRQFCSDPLWISSLWRAKLSSWKFKIRSPRFYNSSNAAETRKAFWKGGRGREEKKQMMVKQADGL